MTSLTKSKKNKLPKSVNEMSKETLQETLQKKRECNARAQKIVESLCEEHIDEEWFLKNLEFINQCHFEDVTIERAILKICGYPLCNKKLQKITHQQYHISTRYNKVFDITERKNFCSSSCYKASNYIKNQLLTSPLWFRDHEVIPKFTILKSNKSSLGEEVQIYEKIKLEPEDIKSLDKQKNNSEFENVDKLADKCSNLIIKKESLAKEIIDNSNSKSAEEFLKEFSKLQIKKENFIEKISAEETPMDLLSNANVKSISSIEKETKTNVSDETEIENKLLQIEGEIKGPQENLNVNDKKNKNNHKLENLECSKKILYDETNFDTKQLDKKDVKNVRSKKLEHTNSYTIQGSLNKNPVKAKLENEEINFVTKVENCIFEWFSVDSVFFLFGEKRLKSLYKDKAEKIKKALNNKLSTISYNEKIDRMIKLYELFGTDSLNENMVRPHLKPLPDYSVLKKEGENLEIKVRAFFKGDLEMKKPAKEEKNEEKIGTAQTDPEIYLPLIDAHSQAALRRKIVLDKLTRLLPELLLIFSRDYNLQMNDVRQLISTFSLTPQNITFKPMEWQLVGIILLKMLSIKDKYLDKILKIEESLERLTIILKNFKLPDLYLEDLIKKLTDSENIIQKLE